MTRLSSNIIGGNLTFWPSGNPENIKQVIGFSSEENLNNNQLSWIDTENIIYDKSPVFTYENDKLTQITYSNGATKIFTYDNDKLVQIVYNIFDKTFTKTFTYDSEDTLISIEET